MPVEHSAANPGPPPHPPLPIPAPLVAALRTAHRVVVLTGAGISAESGVPTFRDAQSGLWAEFKAEDLATPEAFRRNPKLVWEWYASRRARIEQVQPNPGHFALTAMERHVPEFTLVTQNVDGLHQRAGSQRVLELHGNIHRVKCFDENTTVERWRETGHIPPLCPRCGGPLRPDVVWFGELLPFAALAEAERASSTCNLFFAVGTSALVYPAAALPAGARQQGAILVEVNPEPTPLSRTADFSLRGRSGDILPRLVQAAWPSDAP